MLFCGHKFAANGDFWPGYRLAFQFQVSPTSEIFHVVLLGYDTVWFGRQVQMIGSNILHLFAG